jgi:hypothetical protein
MKRPNEFARKHLVAMKYRSQPGRQALVSSLPLASENKSAVLLGWI